MEVGNKPDWLKLSRKENDKNENNKWRQFFPAAWCEKEA